MKVSKKYLIARIYKKLHKAVPKLVIHDVVTAVTDYIVQELSEDRSFSVENFGTFSPYHFHSHEGLDVSSGAMQYVEGFKSVKFRPHAVYCLLLERKRKKFMPKE
jgi:nucleoid DNA-binding protein